MGATDTDGFLVGACMFDGAVIGETGMIDGMLGEREGILEGAELGSCEVDGFALGNWLG